MLVFMPRGRWSTKGLRRAVGLAFTLLAGLAAGCGTRDTPDSGAILGDAGGSRGPVLPGASDASASVTTDAPSSNTAPPDAAATTMDASLPANVDASLSDAQAATALVHFIGRFDTSDPAGPRFAWPGSEIDTTFTGTGIDVMLRDQGSNYFRVVVDGGTPTVVSTSSATTTYTLISNLAGNGPHTLTLTKKTESYAGVVQYLGFAPHGGALVASPGPPARAIEYVGDSITCGYGDLGNGPGCKETNAVEDETVSYAALAAEQLSARQIVIAYSGIGMYRDVSGSTTNQMPVRFTRTLADDPKSVWGFPKPAPDVVVINLGTNDFNSQDGGSPDPGPPFQAAYTAFVQQLRMRYPSAAIICTLSPMLGGSSRTAARTYINAVVTQLTGGGDRHLSFFEFAEQQSSDGLGCDYHPSTTTHQIMATALVPAIRTVAGW